MGPPSAAYSEGRLGSGAVFTDEPSRQRELRAAGPRVDAFRKTGSYKRLGADWARWERERALRGWDVQHQVARLRVGRAVGDQEAGAIYAALADGVRSYEAVVEVSAVLG